MGKTSNAVKDRWNAKAYDQTLIRLPKGRKADADALAEARGLSFNGLINELLRAELGLSEEEYKKRADE